jgi:hypothetical protein
VHSHITRGPSLHSHITRGPSLRSHITRGPSLLAQLGMTHRMRAGFGLWHRARRRRARCHLFKKTDGCVIPRSEATRDLEIATMIASEPPALCGRATGSLRASHRLFAGEPPARPYRWIPASAGMTFGTRHSLLGTLHSSRGPRPGATSPPSPPPCD